MKKFLEETILVGTIYFILIYSFFNTPFSLYFNDASHVFKTLELTKNKINTETVLVGDSVCKQFFEEFNTNEIFCLCSNQAYEVVGNFLILKQLIKNESKFKQFVLVINPKTLSSKLNQPFTYNYFYKPFKSVLDNFDDLESETQLYLSETFDDFKYEPKYRFSSKKYFDNPDMFFGSKEKYEISKVNYKYIKKIQSVCEKNGIKFKMVLPPLPEKWKIDITRFSNRDLNEFSYYFDSGIYYADKFSKDGAHIINPKEFKLQNSFKNYSKELLNTR